MDWNVALKEKFKDDKVGKIKQTCPAKGAKCPDMTKCPMSDEKKKAILAKLRESGKADKIVRAIERGEIEMYEMNDDVRKKYEMYTAVGLHDGNMIFINTTNNDACGAADTAHEVTHVLGDPKNKTDELEIIGMDEYKFRSEKASFQKQNEVWQALKEKYPDLKDTLRDTILEAEQKGKLDQMIRKNYKLRPGYDDQG